jgi:hypothetical protein
MQDEVDALTCLLQRRQVKNAAFAEINAIENVFQVFAFASGEIVDPADLVALRQNSAC